MNKYQAFINGRNFQVLEDGQKVNLGFYTTRWFEAPTPEDAELVAVNLIKSDKNLIQSVLNDANDPPMIFVEELTKLDNFEGVNPPGFGYTFYPEEDEA